jgi:hypothetical protein
METSAMEGTEAGESRDIVCLKLGIEFCTKTLLENFLIFVRIYPIEPQFYTKVKFKLAVT